MNDYLDNLVAKSLGLAEVVAPRPMSLFESAPPDAGLLAPDQFSHEQDGAPQRPPTSMEPVIDVANPSQLPVQSVDRGASQSGARLILNQPVVADAERRADRARSAAPVNQQPAPQQSV